MAEVGDEHTGREIVQPAALGRPEKDAGGSGEDGLGRRVSTEGTRLEFRQIGADGVGARLVGVVQGGGHGGSSILEGESMMSTQQVGTCWRCVPS